MLFASGGEKEKAFCGVGVECVVRELTEALASAIDAKDGNTYGHSHRVGELAMVMGTHLRLDAAQIEELQIAAHLHDVGKIGIPDAILNKSARLTAEEFAVVQRHPVIGWQILRRISSFQQVARIVRHHHERFDGTGYPDRLCGTDIPLASRLIAVADSYDAMTSARSYRKAVSAKEAWQELCRCSGSQFDPEAVKAFRPVVQREREWRSYPADHLFFAINSENDYLNQGKRYSDG